MPFGSFTLGDHPYAECKRSPDRFVADIVTEAITAEQLGNAARIADVPKRVQAAGAFGPNAIALTVILSFNVGLMPHAVVPAEMGRVAQQVVARFA
ncbi:MAG TPA: hypothetical protein VNE67_01450 [Acetobacteraceae bacterium]|nr:hypothetical protein [Acetobacteraceae bacterium]